MRLSRSSRWLLLALILLLVPASSFAGVFVSVGFAPPVLPVYAQPICPQPGLMWTPGYWAYGADDYYWVPGAWVPAPAVGLLWTPPYWGWSGGRYFFHPGYWGHHVGYYGGVNYGFGYGGIGFFGGEWRGGIFAYNTAVMRVGVGGGWGNRVYVDRTVIERNTIVNNNHVSYNGGPGGINHPMSAQERTFTNEAHTGPTGAQVQHENSFKGNSAAYFKNNGGHPQTTAVSRTVTTTRTTTSTTTRSVNTAGGGGSSIGKGEAHNTAHTSTTNTTQHTNTGAHSNEVHGKENEGGHGGGGGGNKPEVHERGK
jgi:hypothetical protein